MTGKLRDICLEAKGDWQCLRDAGHDGPCAAAPLMPTVAYGPDGQVPVAACPDIEHCKEHGCQAKCGPGSATVGLADRFMALFGFKRVSQ